MILDEARKHHHDANAIKGVEDDVMRHGGI
jgi:hypothetical protein